MRSDQGALGVLVGMRIGCRRHVLVMNPDPKQQIFLLQAAHLRQLRPSHPAEPIASVVERHIADADAAIGRCNVIASRQIQLDLPQQLLHFFV